ncbi:type I-E CRISPR-associated protein Cas6/Cse3/CasE [Nocardia sp. NPDC050406]|uniref:type I-E CRISPR-associated protein Cas6/Cse3/CasE n=1 Tax=Nocardia sp. NPDC050406 TaxID=3364318 RepID=UPI00378823DA
MTSFTPIVTLTKIVANPADSRVRHDLRDVQRMHQVLMSLACPPDFGPSSRSAAGLLYRIEHTAVGVHILMQSATQPDPARLSPGYGMAGSRDLTPLLDQLETDVVVRYRIVVNPTKSSHQGADQRGKRQGLAGDEAMAWWARRANQCGLALRDTQMSGGGTITGFRRGQQQRSRIAIATAKFEGVASVKDAAAVRDSILTGIGRGRAYGCGLLSVAVLR